MVETLQRLEAMLPKAGPTVVCIHALNPASRTVSEKQNGVLGSCIGENVLLEVDPTAPGWRDWVPFVMAHEYHHTVWGYHYFFLQGQRTVDLLMTLVVDGLADSFAALVAPGLRPAWNEALTPEQEREQWIRMQEFLTCQDPEIIHGRFMFGDEATGDGPGDAPGDGARRHPPGRRLQRKRIVLSGRAGLVVAGPLFHGALAGRPLGNQQ